MKGEIKLLINEKLRTCTAYRKNISNSELRQKLTSLQHQLTDRLRRGTDINISTKFKC